MVKMTTMTMLIYRLMIQTTSQANWKSLRKTTKTTTMTFDYCSTFANVAVVVAVFASFVVVVAIEKRIQSFVVTQPRHQ
jgi:Ni,Fe-hydrogenase III large subunit